jgi:hypothetical protein
MHRLVQEEIEKIMANAGARFQAELPNETASLTAARAHLKACADCRDELTGMKQQAVLLRQLRVPDHIEAEPRAGFYARVMERIEAEGPVSIWNLFIESAFGRRIAFASLALAVLLGAYLISSERAADDPIVAENTSIGSGQGQVVISRDGGLPEGIVLADPYAAQQQLDSFPITTGAALRVRGQVIGAGPDAMPDDDAVLSNLMGYREQ